MYRLGFCLFVLNSIFLCSILDKWGQYHHFYVVLDHTLSFIKYTFKQHTLITFFLSPTPPRSSTPPYPINFSFPLSLLSKQTTQEQTIKQANKPENPSRKKTSTKPQKWKSVRQNNTKTHVCVGTHIHTQQKWNKKFTRIPLSLLYVGQLLLGVLPTMNSKQFVEKADFPFVHGYQLQIVSWLGLRSGVHFLFLVLGPHMAWTRAGPVHAITASWVLCASVLYVWKTECILGIICLLWLFHVALWTLRGGFNDSISVRAERCKVSHSLHIVQLWVSVHFSLLQEEAALMRGEGSSDPWVL